MQPGAGDNIWPAEKSHEEQEVSKVLSANALKSLLKKSIYGERTKQVNPSLQHCLLSGAASSSNCGALLELSVWG